MFLLKYNLKLLIILGILNIPLDRLGPPRHPINILFFIFFCLFKLMLYGTETGKIRFPDDFILKLENYQMPHIIIHAKIKLVNICMYYI